MDHPGIGAAAARLAILVGDGVFFSRLGKKPDQAGVRKGTRISNVNGRTTIQLAIVLSVFLFIRPGEVNRQAWNRWQKQDRGGVRLRLFWLRADRALPAR